jgi:hypothetical protein
MWINNTEAVSKERANKIMAKLHNIYSSSSVISVYAEVIQEIQ